MSIETMKLALEALENYTGVVSSVSDPNSWTPQVKDEGQPARNAITALRAAIEQAEKQVDKEGSPCSEFWDWLPRAYNFEGVGNFTKYNMEVAFLAGKQFVEQAEKQEPVAWWHDMGDVVDLNVSGRGTPLYTAPPQPDLAKVGEVGVWGERQWQGLTDEDKQIAFDDTQEGGGFWEFADAIEAKLKEKNAL